MLDRKTSDQLDNIIAKQIAKQITANGPISVSEYMHIANDAYYNDHDPLGVNGDFVTAPEISQIFGELIGIWMTDIWIRAGHTRNVNYVELGPGRGTLAKDILRTTNNFDFRPAPFFVESSETLRVKQMEAMPEANLCSNIEELPEDGPLFIVANEFFDALPIRQFIATHSGWRERVITNDKGNSFIAMPGTTDMGNFIPNDLKNVPVDSIYETNPQTSDIIYELINRIKEQGGFLLIIDYGYDASGYGNTLQSVSNHKFANPFEDPGKRDITAHVNFMEIANIARLRNMQLSGPINQGDWLENLGINVRSENLLHMHPERAEEINAARLRLITENEMGRLFKVMAITHSDWPTGEGFTSPIPKIDVETL